jgi:hypothetical protein
LWRAGFAVCGIIIAWQCLISEFYYTRAKWDNSLLAAQFAADLAPFNAQIQRAPAELFLDSRSEIPINVAIEISNHALKRDPYGTDIMLGLADYYAQGGDLTNASKMVNLAEIYAPKNETVVAAKREIERRSALRKEKLNGLSR